MRLVLQQHPEGCGVAVFAMLTDRTWEEAVEYVAFEGQAMQNALLRHHLERDGYFCRKVWDRRWTGGVWPPPPFAPRHYATVQQAVCNGHHLAVEADGEVIDPLFGERRRLSEWEVVHELVGVVKSSAC